METIYTVRTERRTHVEYQIELGAIIPATIMVSLGYLSYAAVKKLLNKK